MEILRRIKMNIVKITAIEKGSIVLIMETDLPSNIWPFEGNQLVKMEIASSNWKTYVETYFPGIPLTLIKI
jgi:hypothetical protein